MQEYIGVIKNYTTFSGRASRREYWLFTLVNFIIAIALAVVDMRLKINDGKDSGILGDLYSVLVLLPSIGVSIRRAHDTSQSGWWILVPFYSLYLMLKPGDKGENKYGPDPYITEKIVT